MNHLREKWGARAKLSSSSSDLDASTANLVGSKRRHAQSSAASASVVATPQDAARRGFTGVETQRYEALVAWIQRSGLSVSTKRDVSREVDAFDEIYESLDDLEVIIKQELALLLPKWPMYEVPEQPCGSSMVDYVVIIGPDLADLTMKTFWMGHENVYEATVVFAHPPHSQFSAESIEQFCFPRGVQTQMSGGTQGDELFVLVLSGGGDQGQSVQYACCLRRYLSIRLHGSSDNELFVPICYAVVVSTPWVSFFYQLLDQLADSHQHEISKHDGVQSSIVPDPISQQVDSLVTALNVSQLPGRAEELRFVWSLDSTSAPRAISCLRPRTDCGSSEAVALLLNWAIPHLLSALEVERVIMAIGLLLVEMKVIVVSTHMPLLSAGTVGLAALLYPLAWAGPLISILPPALLEYLEAPVPLLCGVEALPDYFSLTKGTAILDMDEDIIRLHPEDLSQVGAIQFPGSIELSRQLGTVFNRMKQSGVASSVTVAANYVARRIRRHLQDLLSLCSRVNPCNAYACMKQEQLSLSETLFLKTFMQSQMYQKYNDDQLCEPVQRRTTLAPTETQRYQSETLSSSTLSSSLSSSIHELFQIAVLGYVEPDSTLCSAKEVCGGVATNSQCVLRADEEEVVEPRLVNPCETEEPSKQVVSVQGTSIHEKWVSEPQTKCQIADGDDERKECQTQRFQTDARPHSTPSSPEKQFALDTHSPNQDASRSFPDVLVHEERCLASRNQPPKSLCPTKPPVLQSNAVAEEGGVTNVIDKSLLLSRAEEGSVSSKDVAAAVKIQAAWRAWIRHMQEERQSILSRGFSFGNFQSVNETSYPTPSRDTIDLQSGTTLSILTERAKLLDVRMRLSEDAKRLEWYHRQSLRGAVDLIDLQEVKACGGQVSIQTVASGNWTFVVHPHRASETMAFFQGLHGLVTSSSSEVSSPTTSVHSCTTSQQSVPMFVSSHDRGECEKSQTTTNLSTHELGDATMDGGARYSLLASDENLRKEFLILKHGRMGKPHLKFLVCDKSLQTISWTNPSITNAGLSQPPFVTQHVPGVERKSIHFGDVTDIIRGKHTRVFQRSTAGRSNADLCLSVITKARTLDIETFSREDFTMLFEAVNAISSSKRS